MIHPERIVHRPRLDEPILGIEAVNPDHTVTRLLRSECLNEADYNAKFAYFYEFATEVTFLQPHNIQGDIHENQ